MNAFNSIKSATEPAFTITSTALRAGPDCGNMVPLSTGILLKFMHIEAHEFAFGELPSRQILKYCAQCIPQSYAGSTDDCKAEGTDLADSQRVDDAIQ